MKLPRNILLLYAARGVRGFGDGFATITLPAYLIAIGYDPVRIGAVVAASLLGTAVLTLAVGAIASRYDLRTLMLLGALLMTLTGLAFPNFRHIAAIMFIGFVGSINPSSGDLGVLVPLEQAMLAGDVSNEERTRAFARYSLTGALLTALGTLAAASPDFLQRLGVGALAALTLMFYAYAALGLVCALLYWLLPHVHVAETSRPAPLGPSRGIVYKLSALFSLDAFAGGFIVQSLLALWLFERFNLSLSAASVFFFWSSLLSALSFPVAAWLSRRFGLVNTMVFTHVPSNLFLILAAFSSSLEVTLGLLLLRSALSQMDVPTRTSYIMAVVTPAERAAAASVTAVPRSLASALSPTLAGALFASPFSALPLLICGSLKLVYDVALLFSFRHLKAPEEAAHGAHR
ncbi:MAG: MFS transporter [Xanthobacteraceae bacterium]